VDRDRTPRAGMPVRSRSIRPHDERGLVLALAALTLVTLLAFAALAVDFGGLYNARRQDQSAADMAALAAAQDLPQHGAVASVAIAYAEESLGVAPGTFDFDTCAGDPQALANQVAGANCVSINDAGNRVRVRLPDQEYETFFARLVGLEQFTHSAFAEAELRGAGFGNVLPFGIPSLGNGGGYICPGTPPAGLATEPCSGPDSGNFGYLNLAFFQEPKSCNQGGGANRFGQNLAMGADHDLARYLGDWRYEFDLCPIGIGPAGAPNVMRTETGNIAGRVAEGMVSGPGNPAVTYPDGDYGRLTRQHPELLAGPNKPTSVAPATVTFGLRVVDDNPLWNFVPDPEHQDPNVPASCLRSVFVDSSGAPRTDLSGLVPNFPTQTERDTFFGLVQGALAGSSDAEIMIALLDRCFTHYLGGDWGADYGIVQGEPSACGPGGCTGAVFGLNSSGADAPDLFDIQYTPRFGYVPEFVSGCDPNGTDLCPIERFRAVFIQQVCTGQGTNCTSHDPGFGVGRSEAPNSIAGVTAWAFPDTMLPGGLGSTDAPTAIGVNRFVFLVR
jgi:hypothetical protein